MASVASDVIANPLNCQSRVEDAKVLLWKAWAVGKSENADSIAVTTVNSCSFLFHQKSKCL